MYSGDAYMPCEQIVCIFFILSVLFGFPDRGRSKTESSITKNFLEKFQMRYLAENSAQV